MRLTILAICFSLVAPAARADCTAQAWQLLQAHSAHGVKVFRDFKKPVFFFSQVDCDNLGLGLATAVHESVHRMYYGGSFRGEHFYYLMDGRWASVPNDDEKHFPQKEILADLGSAHPKDNSYDTYLSGAEKDQDLTWTLEELNAYTHDLWVATDLREALPEGIQYTERDSVASFLLYVKLYLARARAHHPKTWSYIVGQDRYPRTIRLLWDQAEAALSYACPSAQLGIRDREILREVYLRAADGSSSALEQILGRVPTLPESCRLAKLAHFE